MWSGVKRKVEISGSLDLRSSTIQRIRSIWLFIPTAYLDISRVSCPTFLFVLLPPLQIQRRRGRREREKERIFTGISDKNKLDLFEAHSGMQLNFIMSVIVTHIKREYRAFDCSESKLNDDFGLCLAPQE